MPAPDDLFSVALEERLASRAPLAARMRPRTLDEVAGQEHLLAPGKPLRALIEGDRISSLILWGPPGTGKTTLARLIAADTSSAFVPLSAVTAGVKDVREVIEGARRRLAEQSQSTILFLDEVHRFNKSQQDALLPAVEEGVLILIGATTENPFFEVNAPLLSRSTLFRLEPLDTSALKTVVRRALEHEKAEATDEAIDLLVDLVDGDARAALTSLEVAIALAGERHLQTPYEGEPTTNATGSSPSTGAPPASSGATIDINHIEAARSTRALRYERDDHYDVISAFIKSIRGSDADAGLYWLARMLAAGEDARFIARRLVILASEDIGLADSFALVVADAAARAVEFVGLPEAQLNLAHAVTYLATAPKSNRVTTALGQAKADVEARPAGPVPPHLRDGHYRGAAVLGHGAGYSYPHDAPSGWVAQEYRPDEVAGRVYYQPSIHGQEREIGERLRAIRANAQEPTKPEQAQAAPGGDGDPTSARRTGDAVEVDYLRSQEERGPGCN